MATATAKIVRFHSLGGPEVLKIQEEPIPEPEKGEVRLNVKAIGLNRAEVMFRLGRYLEAPALPAKLGYEAAGVVAAVGPDVDKSWLGKKASTVPAFLMTQYGVYGEVAIVPASALALYPEKLTPEEGTSIWMQYLTAYGALIAHSQITKGDFVIITAASSSVGIAAIEMANAEGAVSIATTRTSKKKASLLEVGAAHVIATEEQDLVAEVNRITDGKGARVVFDPVGGANFSKLISVLTFQGIAFIYGALDEGATSIPVLEMVAKLVTVKAHTIWVTSSDETRRKAAVEYVLKGLESGALRPVIDRSFKFDEMREVHRYLENNGQFGKIVVTV